METLSQMENRVRQSIDELIRHPRDASVQKACAKTLMDYRLAYPDQSKKYWAELIPQLRARDDVSGKDIFALAIIFL